MATTRNRKRRSKGDTTQAHSPEKSIRSTSTLKQASNFPPEFWDTISKVVLTSRALREIDRRHGNRSSATSAPPDSTVPTTLARFARHGGPDLRHLRAYPEPTRINKMRPNRLSTLSRRRRISATGIICSSIVKRSSAYDDNFEQKLADHGVYPEDYEHGTGRTTHQPNNLEEVNTVLDNARASLSPSSFSSAAFADFKQAHFRVISEGNVMTDLLPTICGKADIPSEGNLAFRNLNSITNETSVDSVPDLYDGSYPKDVNKAVREDLGKMIIPTRHGRAPLAPNFFLEGKAPKGGAEVSKRQACLDGAVRARAMLSLQNYGEDEILYDGNAYTFSAIYHAGTGTLQLYAHHVTAPTAKGESAEYHMTEITGEHMKKYLKVSGVEQPHSETFGIRLGESESLSSRQPMLKCRNQYERLLRSVFA